MALASAVTRYVYSQPAYKHFDIQYKAPSMIFRKLRCFQIYGANTDVGKTIVSTTIAKSLLNQGSRVAYLKPVSTGPDVEADDIHIKRFAPEICSKVISQFKDPVSPHIAAAGFMNNQDYITKDTDIVDACRKTLNEYADQGFNYTLVETAGGVLSPGPSGSVQGDIYRPLRLPALLVGDPKLGGVATTLSAYESLTIRGYDVAAVVLFDLPKWGNGNYLKQYFAKREVPVFAWDGPPEFSSDPSVDEANMRGYYDRISDDNTVSKLCNHLNDYHETTVTKLSKLVEETEAVVWHPFRQHQQKHDIVAIDSAYDDKFEIKGEEGVEDKLSSELTKPFFDGSASWWTQGLGHGNPHLSLKAAYAAGRYGHVMFAHAAHQPALDITKKLSQALGNPRVKRSFFSDNGSTAMEVAVKMALGAARKRYGWSKSVKNIEILGLTGSYHGDTIGVMNCSDPNTFNENVDWHKPWGYWFDPPELSYKDGSWTLTIPETISEIRSFQYRSLKDIFNFSGREIEAKIYRNHIFAKIKHLVYTEGRNFGALILEPILMGAGGMIFVDPLFQRTLVEVIRENPELISHKGHKPVDDRDWSGVPVIADEVFTGLYRLGRSSSTSLWSSDTRAGQQELAVSPDISAHAKLLTGGIVPLSITMASESIFESFLSNKVEDALLHGHSYTAHAIGCTVGSESLEIMKSLDSSNHWNSQRETWYKGKQESMHGPIFSLYDPSFLEAVSREKAVASCFALGTVFVIKFASAEIGYTSTASKNFQVKLLASGVHARVLGNVIYLIASLTTPASEIEKLQNIVLKAF